MCHLIYLILGVPMMQENVPVYLFQQLVYTHNARHCANYNFSWHQEHLHIKDTLLCFYIEIFGQKRIDKDNVCLW